MNMLTDRGIEAYRLNQLELSIHSAQPVELIVLLYDGAIESVRRAGLLLKAGDVPGKAREITRATNIISELHAVIDLSQGEVAANLAALYDYMRGQLLQANLHNSGGKLDEIAALLATLREAWAELVERSREKSRPLSPGEPAARAG
ncbi:MAG: flagellar export chaperone FliS [Burkholderiales bacterium]|jgi:flagellar protein FliS|nr:flagellar export chaperone FliS [Betaproteobacteria bacterium]